jgi:hypothetical protein
MKISRPAKKEYLSLAMLAADSLLLFGQLPKGEAQQRE